MVTRPGGGEFGGAEASFAVVFTSLETAQDAMGAPRAVNDLVLDLAPGADRATVADELSGALQASGLTGTVTTQADETAHRILYKDAEGHWKDSASFNPADLPLLIKVADQAYTWIHQGAGDAADASGFDETEPATTDTPPGGDDAV